MADTMQFLNVDLEISSKSSLAPLIAELSVRMFQLYKGRYGGMARANFEVNKITLTADATIKEIVRVVEGLGPAARRCWDKAHAREFDVGIQAGMKPPTIAVEIDPKTVQAVAALDGRIVITVYAPYEPSKPERKQAVPRRRA